MVEEDREREALERRGRESEGFGVVEVSLSFLRMVSMFDWI